MAGRKVQSPWQSVAAEGSEDLQAWLRGELQAEREALAAELLRRHEVLLAAAAGKLASWQPCQQSPRSPTSLISSRRPSADVRNLRRTSGTIRISRSQQELKSQAKMKFGSDGWIWSSREGWQWSDPSSNYVSKDSELVPDASTTSSPPSRVSSHRSQPEPDSSELVDIDNSVDETGACMRRRSKKGPRAVPPVEDFCRKISSMSTDTGGSGLPGEVMEEKIQEHVEIIEPIKAQHKPVECWQTLPAGSPKEVPLETEEDCAQLEEGRHSRRKSRDLDILKRSSIIVDALEVDILPWWHPTSIAAAGWFDMLFCTLIMLNALVVSIEMQYNSIQLAYQLKLHQKTALQEWPGAKESFIILESLFGSLFALEILVKMIGLGRWFAKDAWNLFDASIVVFWMVDSTLAAFSLEIDPTYLRTARLARLLRLLRLVRRIQAFDSLYIITTAMKGSMVILFWSFILLFLIHLILALLFNLLLESYIKDPSIPQASRVEVFKYFGSTSRGVLTMFELTLANWPPVARLLQELISEWYIVFVLAHKLVIGFAVIGVINGVFMQETFKVAASDDKIMMRQKERERALHTQKMNVLFEHADESGDGFLDIDEFRTVLSEPQVQTWLSAQELNVSDPDILFRLLDDGDAQLTAEELVDGVGRLKGPAKGYELAALGLETRTLQKQILERLDSMASRGVAVEGSDGSDTSTDQF